ncbi:FAD-dependent monooxygenase [Paraburkholderia tropica]|uniref:FAD-dependent monooxygenase n=1 Tax=Paraburkholderia tropica TaxID=92647 RepID=UPI002AB120C3|nr:FAD-dependent monooxygenase [Paraburkholderia tropica]
MACVSKGLIVGGGIAGLSAAIALERVGVHCDVVEIGEKPVGAAISLTGRATEALAELGVYEECYATSRPFTDEMSSPVMRDAAGIELGPPPPPRPAWPGAKTGIGIYRPALAQILNQTAQGLGARIETGVTVETLQEVGDEVVVVLSNGEERRYDFVIGADGINSRTRTMLFPDAPQPAYAGQMSIRWMIPGPAIPGEAWYVAGKFGRLGFFHMPHQNLVYTPIVVSVPETRLSQQDAYELVGRLLDMYTAPAVGELRKHLHADSTFICRPFRSILLKSPWFSGRTLLIGDAAHATTAHMGMGAGMALEDAVVLAQCIAGVSSLADAYETFMARRFERVRTVVETSVALSKLEQTGAPGPETKKLMGAALATISQPY